MNVGMLSLPSIILGADKLLWCFLKFTFIAESIGYGNHEKQPARNEGWHRRNKEYAVTVYRKLSDSTRQHLNVYII